MVQTDLAITLIIEEKFDAELRIFVCRLVNLKFSHYVTIWLPGARTQHSKTLIRKKYFLMLLFFFDVSAHCLDINPLVSKNQKKMSQQHNDSALKIDQK